jgi:pyridoxal phosphate enzyme (YggS family)
MTVAERFESIKRELGNASVTIVGVTKIQPVELVREAVACGVRVLANNYVQEGAKLREALGDAAVEWHFIGHIQSRKAKDLTGYHCVQSLDRLSVAEELNKRLDRKLDVLVEVNIGNESEKSGIAPEALEEFMKGMEPFTNLKVKGIMGMPPPLQPVELRRPYFKELRALRDRFGLATLSMGTSNDYLVAVEEGATMIRLGTVLFGERPQK